MISLRLKPEILKLLDRVSKTPNTVYTGKSRTYLIERAIADQYNIYKQNGE